MKCRYCQRDMADTSNFCPFCGAPQQIPCGSSSGFSKRLMRSASDRKIAGVCGGIAEYIGVDSTFVRLIWLLLIILPVPLVPAFLGYLAAWIVMPQERSYSPAATQQPPVIIPNSTQTG